MLPTESSDTSPKTKIAKPEVPETKEPGVDDGFKDVYFAFIQSITSKNKDAFNKFIHPKHGLSLLQSSGAMPNLTKVSDISTFKTKNNKSFTDINPKAFDCTLTMNTLPVVDSVLIHFTQSKGCFAQKINNFKNDKIWTYCSLDKNAESMAQQAAETITYTVINTNNFRYYLSFIDGNWYVTFIDLRRPCNA